MTAYKGKSDAMLQKVISGGQTGVDSAGLRAARYLGYKTGGTCPKGWKNEDGCALWLRDYGLKECHTEKYAFRTNMNILGSDATLLILKKPSPGSRLILEQCRHYKKPSFKMPVVLDDYRAIWITAVQDWLKRYEICTLNIAGNHESVAPGIEDWAYGFLLEALLFF